MSQDTSFLELKNCIAWRLWYTAHVLHRIKGKSYFSDDNGAVDLCRLLGHLKSTKDVSLIIYKLSATITNKNDDKTQLNLVQFENALHLIDKSIPEPVEQELLKLHEAIKVTNQDTEDEISAELTETSIQFLEQNLWHQPSLVHWVIDQLLCIWLISFNNSDSALQDIYVKIIKQILTSGNLFVNEAPQACYSPRNVSCIDQSHLATLLCVLSKFDLIESKEDDLQLWLCPQLLQTCRFEDVELAFYSRRDSKYLKLWHSFIDDTYARDSNADSLDEALKINRAIFATNKDNLVSLNTREIFIRVLRRKVHWLSEILEVCYTLSINNRLEDVAKVLENPIFDNLWLPLLFKFLSNCPNIQINSSSESYAKSLSIYTTLRSLLKHCKLRFANDPTMTGLYSTLDDYLDVLEWIIKCKKTKDTEMPPGSNHQHCTFNQIFQHLQTSTLLSTAKNFVADIHNKPFDEINLLLKNSSESRVVYRAYYAMLSALKAILLCHCYNSEFEAVAEHYEVMEKHINTLRPLDLRLEVIENIFSMMFLRHEDFYETENTFEHEEDEAENDQVYSSPRINSDYQSGFICNKYAIRETLHHLGRCVFVLADECAKLNDKSDVKSIEERLQSIKNYLTEATWRLELLANAEFTKKQGLPDSNVNSPVTNIKIVNSYNNSQTSAFYKTDESSSDEAEQHSDIDLSSESSPMGNLINRHSKCRRKVRSSSQDEPSGRRDFKQSGEFTLNYMLATKETLVLKCLWKDNYAEAEHVIKIFNMKNNRLAGEIRFSRAMRTFRQDMTKQLTLVQPANVEPKLDSKHSTLEFIRKAAREGIQATRTTSQVETFLASQEANILLCSDSTNAQEIMTLTTMDLALTMGLDSRISENLVEVAMKHLKSCKKLENTRFFEFFQIVYQLFYEKKSMSMVNILCDAKIPLSVKEHRESNDYWMDLSKKLKIFENKTRLIDLINVDNNVQQLKNEVNQVLSIFSKGEPYFHRLIAHLELIRSIAPTANDIDTTNLRASLLENSLHSYIGYQIFDCNVDLETLEKIANQLQVNLVYGILVNCCPKLPCKENYDNEIKYDKWGIVVLNKFDNTDEFINTDARDPNQCVVEILSELLEVFEDWNPTFISRRDIKNYCEREIIVKILRKTQLLANLDLSQLSFGNHTLAFFLNIFNLLIIHAILQAWCTEPPLNDLQHTISVTTIGYELGDLGLVTLFALRSKLLGESLCNLEFFGFDHPEELNEPAWQDLDLQRDPRVILAMINEYKDSPIIKIYHPNTLNDDLNAAVENYLRHYINNQNEHIIGLPQFVKKYGDLLTRIEGTENNLEKFLGTAKSVEYEPFEYSYGIQLKYTEEKKNSVIPEAGNSTDSSSWKSRIIKPNLLQYLEGHCWLLSYLLQRIHEENPSIVDSADSNFSRTSVLENLLNSPWSESLKCLFDDNRTVASLWKQVSTIDLWNYFQALLEDHNEKKCLEILDALPDSLLMRNVEIQSFQDKILTRLITDSSTNDAAILQYVYRIKNVQVLAQIILSRVKEWPVRVCEEALRHVLSHTNNNCLPAHCRSTMNEILCRVMVFDKMLPYCKLEHSHENINWYNMVYRTEKTDPNRIVKSLIDANQYELCLEWLEYQTNSIETHSLVSQDLFLGLLKNEKDNFKHARKLLQALPVTLSVKLCRKVIRKLESMTVLRFVVAYLFDNCPNERKKYQRAFLGIEILEQLDPRDRSLYIHLINEPLLMFEQLLMNCKFDSLQRILKTHSESLASVGIPAEDFDEVVRLYAKKSLDSRVAVARDTGDSRSRDSSLNQSVEFVMPLNTPTREEWIPNDKASNCSCCKTVIFSMFNRRHHCRRCGRVVCGGCSGQRMRVPGYAKSVLVRVCDECKRQTALQSQGVASTASSETFDCWKLSTDTAHNRALREEFCFEYAPNISLCLAILNLHSDHKAYATFLLDRCDEMKKLLHPDSKGQINPEVDHSLIIKMIRSLLVAAKVKCAKLGLNTGLADCDRFLSQVDLIATLVASDCLSLIPQDDLNDHTLRRLRDLLTEKEQWILALDVSTKSGLDTQGVWAAWGKACLKVGYYDRAREKFTHCLDKVHQDDFDDWVVLSYPGESGLKVDRDIEKKETKIRDTLKNRPTKDPPLLAEILQILEVSNSTDQYSQQLARAKTATAQEILNRLNSLKAISHGQYTTLRQNSNPRNVRYQEGLYYLLMYGSFNSILEFFVRYEEFDKCLVYILENDIDPELFYNVVFLGCLKNGTMTNLCAAMKNKDPSLLLWKKYLICTCHNLERKQLLNSLYQLQLFMKDYVRAAMTCIRFYVTDASSYVDICSRSYFLLDAQRHLEAELQLETFGKRRRKSTCSLLNEPSGLTMEMEPSEIDKHINTISRQMEIAKFLGACEREGRSVNEFLSKLSFMDSEGLQPRTVPTLFGNQQERTYLSVLAILCGRDVEEGFGVAFRVMQDYNLRPQKVYSLVGHILALDRKINSIEQLIKCCRSSGAPNSIVISDRVLAHCVKFLLERSKTEATTGPKDQIDSLIRLITDVELKIGSYIESKQLKAAYLLAVKHSRAQDIRKILKEADRIGQPAIKSICTKWFQQTQQN